MSESLRIQLDFEAAGSAAATLDRMADSAKRLNDAQDVFRRKVSEGNTALQERMRLQERLNGTATAPGLPAAAAAASAPAARAEVGRGDDQRGMEVFGRAIGREIGLEVGREVAREMARMMGNVPYATATPASKPSWIRRMFTFAGGGVVPGHGDGDTVPAMLSAGEFVVKKSSAQQIGYDRLHGMNEGRHLATGGFPSTTPMFEDQKLQVQDEQLQHIKKHAAAGNMSVSAYKDKVGAQIKGIIDKSALVTRLPFHVLHNIIKDGRVKTGYETHTSGGGDYDGPEFRSKGESAMIGIPEDTADKNRPVYGHLADKEHPHKHFGDVSSYGSVVAVLHDSVRERTTFTRGDSLNNGANVYASPLSKPDIYSMDFETDDPSKHGQNLKKMVGNENLMGRYMETQFHGGIKLSDVVEMIFTEQMPSAQLQKLMGEKGVDWRHQKAEHLARGGSVDSVPAMLTPGEFVLSRHAASMIGHDALHRMNRTGEVQRFAGGGWVHMAGGGDPRGAQQQYHMPPPLPGTSSAWHPGRANKRDMDVRIVGCSVTIPVMENSKWGGGGSGGSGGSKKSASAGLGPIFMFNQGMQAANTAMGSLATGIGTMANTTKVFSDVTMTSAQQNRAFSESLPIIGAVNKALHEFEDAAKGTATAIYLARKSEQTVTAQTEGSGNIRMAQRSADDEMEHQQNRAKAFRNVKLADAGNFDHSTFQGDIAYEERQRRLPLLDAQERAKAERDAAKMDVDSPARAARMRALEGKRSELGTHAQQAFLDSEKAKAKEMGTGGVGDLTGMAYKDKNERGWWSRNFGGSYEGMAYHKDQEARKEREAKAQEGVPERNKAAREQADANVGKANAAVEMNEKEILQEINAKKAAGVELTAKESELRRAGIAVAKEDLSILDAKIQRGQAQNRGLGGMMPWERARGLSVLRGIDPNANLDNLSPFQRAEYQRMAPQAYAKATERTGAESAEGRELQRLGFHEEIDVDARRKERREAQEIAAQDITGDAKNAPPAQVNVRQETILDTAKVAEELAKVQDPYIKGLIKSMSISLESRMRELEKNQRRATNEDGK